MDKLDLFTQSYIVCALWSSTDDSGTPLDSGRDASDIAQETLKQMIDDCAAFQRDNADLLAATGATPDQNGHDFWLTRNHHGAGFWDRGYHELGTMLTEAAHAYGSVDLVIGDNGLIY